MGKLTFSVIVPVFNKRQYLDASFKSILCQLSDEDELILIDDGSTDGSELQCDEYAAEYSNVAVFHQENKGVSFARNLGITKAKGTYVLFVDCDDTIDDGLIGRASSIMNDTRLMIFGMSFDYYKDDRLIRNEVLSYSKDCQFRVSQIPDDLEQLFVTNSLSSACNKVFEADMIRNHHLVFNENMYLYEDLDFVLKYLSVLNPSDRISIVKEPYYHYRLTADQSNLGKRVSDLSRLVKNMEQLRQGFEQFDTVFHAKDASKKLFTEIYLDLLYTHLINSDNIKQSSELIILNVKLSDSDLLLDGNRKILYECIQKKNTKELIHYIQKKKLKASARKTIKKMIGR